MRTFALLLIGALAGCGAKVNVDESPYDLDVPRDDAPAAPKPVAWEMRPDAPTGPGVRTGTIARASLLAVLDLGPGAFLRAFEVAPEMDGQRFAGWRLVQWVAPGERRFAGIDLVPGDVLLAVNGQALSRPDQLQGLWTSLRTADKIVAELGRGNGKVRLEFAIEPAMGLPAAPVVPETAVPTTVAPPPVMTPPVAKPSPTDKSRRK
ncbi:MAG: hypothetical protein K8W52_40640 [Deltaproteobacteria bacterium]|nr:hypothetical protein [Deltaproteobacteria bacterium]